MNIFAILKSKIQLIILVFLLTLLSVSYISGKSDREQLTTLNEKLLEHVKLNKSLSDQNLAMAEEIKNKPKEYIVITKEIEKEICNGIVRNQLIDSLPTRQKETVNEEDLRNTVDIDDRLPSNLIKLLK